MIEEFVQFGQSEVSVLGLVLLNRLFRLHRGVLCFSWLQVDSDGADVTIRSRRLHNLLWWRFVNVLLASFRFFVENWFVQSRLAGL